MKYTPACIVERIVHWGLEMQMDQLRPPPLMTPEQALQRYDPILSYEVISESGDKVWSKIDLKNNGKIAHDNKGFQNSIWFKDQVKTGGEWDYKNKKYLKLAASKNVFSFDLLQEFGNYHFGYMAACFGFPLSVSLSGAGVYQVLGQGAWQNSFGAYRGFNFMQTDIKCHPEMIWDNSDIEHASTPELLTRLGFEWGDMPGDSLSILTGWLHGSNLFP
jgi:hypothetical protein